MGVQITEIMKGRDFDVSQLSGKKIAIDAYNWAYQFLSIIRDRFTGEPLKDSKGRITSAYSGFFYRTAKLMEAGITPVYVFDGTPPAFKSRTIESRRVIKEEAMGKLERAREEGDKEKIRLYAQATSKFTMEMREGVKELLGFMGVACVQAPSEGEAQMARTVKENCLWAGASQDWDSLMFGSPRLIRNLSITGKRKVARKEAYVEVKPELLELQSVLSGLGITREQLIIMGILIGTDYNPGGVRGIGPKNALKLVKEHRTLDGVMRGIEWEFDASPSEIYDFFMNPPTESCSIPDVKPDWEKAKQFLVDHDFSEERINSTLDKIKKARERTGSSLDRWLR
ncbi:MAG: flap endonuclease-1 [Candidatus Aenigmarchaeota archaeon]|nr:flap endonuclease-1 [Candidatus Aenigmarchaeota archaeon]